MTHNTISVAALEHVARLAAQLAKQPRAAMHTADTIAADAIKVVVAAANLQAGRALRLSPVVRRIADRYDAELHILQLSGARAVAFRFRSGTWTGSDRNLFRVL